MKQRQFSRVDYHVNAVITCDSDSFPATVKNISLHGVLVQCERIVDIGKLAEITISLVTADTPIEIRLNGVVVRSGDGELGLRFDKIELDSFVHLRNLVSIAKGDADGVMNEFIDFVGANVQAADDHPKG